ncbi:alpha/beta hydrolase family esterase [Halobacillus litoralis]|uniref:alpha/beta hydrolase family esterase n=1 Tax=Halobacillus litoralis TaxID=45668 RepID=UPI0024921BF5|nr:PHB depolymerase family esterase [Halobacillus litoralis]
MMNTHVQVAKDSIPSKDGDRTFYYTLPESEGEPVPLVFCFHGAGSSAKYHMSMTNFHELAAKAKACFVFPEAVQVDPDDPMSKQFNEGRRKNKSFQNEIDDAGFVLRLIDYFRSLSHIDETRIFLSGFSNGSAFAMKLAIENPDLFAAVGGVSGPVVKEVAARVEWSKPMPLIFFMGEDDRVVPYDGVDASHYMIDQLLSAKGTAQAFACSLPAPMEEKIQKDGKVTQHIYQSGDEGAEVIFYSIEGSGHTWPGGSLKQESQLFGKVSQELDAAGLMWSFFEKMTKEEH